MKRRALNYRDCHVSIDETTTVKWIDRTESAIALVIQFSILGIALTSLADRQWLTAFSGIVVIMLTLVPPALERQLHVRLPVEVTLFVCVFLFASFALGEVRGYYEQLWWWDLLLHGSSAVVMGLIGFLMVYVFYMTHRVRIAPIYVAAISFGTAVTVGSLWEIFEYLMDLGFNLNMQRSGLKDTMSDLIVNTIGALLAAAIGYYYVRQGDELMGHRVIRSLVERGRRVMDKEPNRKSGEDRLS